MEIIIILVIITLVFSITIGLIIMTRDEVPDVLVEEVNDALDSLNSSEELEELEKASEKFEKSVHDLEVTITKDEEENKEEKDNVDDNEVI